MSRNLVPATRQESPDAPAMHLSPLDSWWQVGGLLQLDRVDHQSRLASGPVELETPPLPPEAGTWSAVAGCGV